MPTVFHHFLSESFVPQGTEFTIQIPLQPHKAELKQLTVATHKPVRINSNAAASDENSDRAA